MFATASRSRPHGTRVQDQTQAVEPPPAGSDSCFGVRSLNGSVEWSGVPPEAAELGGERGSELEVDEAGQEDAVDTASVQAVQGPALGDDGLTVAREMEEAALGSILSQTSISASASTSTSTDSASSEHASTSNAVQADPAASQTDPSPPALLLPTLSTSAVASATSSSPSTPPTQGDRTPSHYSFTTDEAGRHHVADDGNDDYDDDASSAPPSPTSLNSMPSYLASDFSLPSSPGLGYLTDPGSIEGRSGSRSRSPRSPGRIGSVAAALEAYERNRIGIHRSQAGRSRHRARPETGEDTSIPDLVLPTLSLPSSSLHLSLRPYTGPKEALKVALIGDAESVKAFMRVLEQKEDLVDIGKKGAVGMVRQNQLVAVLLPGLSVSQVRIRAISSYSTLHSLLNPATSQVDQAKLRDMAARYAEREEWVHGCIALNDDPSTTLQPLAHLVHQLQHPAEVSDLGTNKTDRVANDAQATSPVAYLDDPTPMARIESASYFQHPLSSEPPISPISESPPLSTAITSAISNLLATLDAPNVIVTESVNRFLAWRPPPLDSSNSSLETTSASAGSSGAAGLDKEFPPMPTVARAQGGGEWEADLSRRMAKRRETDTHGAGGSRAGTGVLGTTASTGPSKRPSGKQPEGRGSTSSRRRRSKGSGGSRESGSGRSADAVPLFPPRPTSTGPGYIESRNRGLNVLDLVEKTFRPIKQGLSGWKGFVVFAAVVGVVGFGWWIGKKA